MKSDKRPVISGNVEENMRKKASRSFPSIAPQLTINLARTLMNSGISSFPGEICRVQTEERDRGSKLGSVEREREGEREGNCLFA